MAAPRWFWCCPIVTGGAEATTISVSKTFDLEPTKSAQKSRRKLRSMDVGFRGVLEPILFPFGNTNFGSVFVFPSRNTVVGG
jgi:hypothetical protein